MKHKGYDCDCEACRAVRQLWHAAAVLEDPEQRLLLDGNGALALSERSKAVIRSRGGVVSPFFDERNQMHASAESVEDEMRRTVGRILGDGDPDVEIKEVRTGIEGIHRFEVTVKRPELTNGEELKGHQGVD